MIKVSVSKNRRCTSRTFFFEDLSLEAQATDAPLRSSVNSGTIWDVLV